jgi:RHS repeat-associated protein
MTAGNGTTFSYDAANRLKGSGGVANQYGYDGDGKRVRQPGLYYVWSSVLGKVAFEVDASANVQRAYVYLGDKIIALQSTDGNFYWAHTDHLNSGRMLTNTAGAVVYRGDFDPFGQVTYEWSASGNVNLNTRKFTGYERDATGLDYAVARSYTSSWGRFAQSDPYGSGYRGEKPNPLGAANIGLPQTHNRYSYAWNDPLTLTDPSGLRIDPCCACPGHGECEGREPICPTGGGGGGGGGSACDSQQAQACKDCCTSKGGDCKSARDLCIALVFAAVGAAVASCLATVCRTNPIDSDACQNCLISAGIGLGAGLGYCGIRYVFCTLDATRNCALSSKCSTCKC